jgi:hypothetical protein
VTLEEWATIKNFTPSASPGVLSFGDPLKMDFPFMQKLDSWADFIKCKPIVLYGTQGMHVVDSEHYYGLAVDLVVPDYKSKYPLFDLALSAMRFNFRSVGIYPGWQYNEQMIGGLHIGDREQPFMHQWMGVRKDGDQNYISLNGLNLKSYGVI